MNQDFLSRRQQAGRKSVPGVAMLASVIALLGGQSLTEAQTHCKVGGASPTHTSINLAVDDPSCERVMVAKGTYTEAVSITRSVELRGSGSGTVIQAAGGGCIVSISGSNVQAEVARFTISGPVPEGTASLMGVCVDAGASAEIGSNTITDIREDTFSGFGSNENFAAIMIGSGGSPGTAEIRGNRIQEYQKSGIVVDGVGSFAEISKNTVFGSPRVSGAFPSTYGIQVSRGATAEVTSNRVLDNSNLASSALSAGILLFEAGDDVEVSKNTLSGNDTGISVNQTNKALIEGNVASDSTFDGISLGNQDPTKTTENNVVSRNRTHKNGEGITLFSANNNAVVRNISNNNNGAGLFVSCDDAGSGCTQPASSGNTITTNTANLNLIGYQDESTGGGTAGTANTYTDNKCKGNFQEGSDPDGLCLPQQP